MLVLRANYPGAPKQHAETKCWFFLIPRFNQLTASESFTQSEGDDRFCMWSAYWLATKPNQRLCAKMQQPDREESERAARRRVCIWGLWRRRVRLLTGQKHSVSALQVENVTNSQHWGHAPSKSKTNVAKQCLLGDICVCMHVSIHALTQSDIHRGRGGVLFFQRTQLSD
jgi:hypothetical protein